MIIEVDKAVWIKSSNDLTDSIFFNPEFLQVISDSFPYNVHYLLAVEDGFTLAIAAVFSKGGEIVIPLTFTYSSIAFDKNISERKYLEVFQNILKYMQSRWSKIQLRIGGGDRFDMRPFLWTGFQITPRFTYIKDVNKVDVHKSVEINFRKSLQLGLSFKSEKPCSLSIERNLSFLTKQGLSVQDIKPYYNLFYTLAEQGSLISFNAYQNNVLVCSNLVLVDSFKKVYTLLIHPVDLKDVHTYIYIKALQWMNKQGVELVDYCGANHEGIATFKSYFNPVLQPYFLAMYDERKLKMKLALVKIKTVLKQVLGRV